MSDKFALYNPGFQTFKMPQGIFEYVKILTTIPQQSDSVNHENFTKAPRFIETAVYPELRHFLCSCYESWCRNNDVDKKYVISSVWTNYLYKGDFIPNHVHHPVSNRSDPAAAGFVLWVNIPYTIEEERKYSGWEDTSVSPRNGCVEFVYSQFDGKTCIKTILIDKSLEGTMLMFPGNMIHCVYPFYTSDEPRISISGNITIK